MLEHSCRVLLVEDEQEDIETVQTMLSDARSAFFQRGFELVCAETLAQAKQILFRQEFDVILLDLMLPDSRHINSLREVQTVNSSIPIIVQTALEDEVVAVKALELGACGYLPKIASDRNLLLYGIRTAIERKIKLTHLEKSQAEQQEREIDVLEQLLRETANLTPPSIDSLEQRMSDVWAELEERYQKILNQSVEQKIYRVDYELSNQVNVLAQQLGYLQASPRDLIELHTEVLKQKQDKLGQKKSRIFTVEGRYLLLELMGKLAAYYRRYYIGLNKINLAQNYHNMFSSES